MNVPRDIARCPTCNGQLFIEVEEWEADTHIPTEAGLYVHCYTFHKNAIADQMPYTYWLPMTTRVYEWAQEHVRVSHVAPHTPITVAEFEWEETIPGRFKLGESVEQLAAAFWMTEAQIEKKILGAVLKWGREHE